MFLCSNCSRSFSRPENLSRHARTHKAVLPYACPTCNRGFSRSDLLAKHEKLHNKPGDGAKKRTAQVPGPTDPGGPKPKRPRGLDGGPPARAESHVPSIEPLTASRASAVSGATLNATPHSHHRGFQVVGSGGPTLPSHFNSTASNTGSPNVLPPLGSMPMYADVDPQSHYFDFMSFSKPWNGDMLANSPDWFSLDFYEALHETNCNFDGTTTYPRNTYSPSVFPLEYLFANSLEHRPSNSYEQPDPRASQPPNHDDSEKMSCAASPPNEASYEDRLPFAWNPKSRGISSAKPICLDFSDPLVQNHDPRFDISDRVLEEVAKFLDAGVQTSPREAFTLPPLYVVNAFIGLFFKHFSCQASVLHHPTVDTNTLPRSLLAVIIVVGAIYSGLRRTLRFAIILLERVRRNLQLDIENDNSLMREPLIIYACALVCYAGLWCGNKRAFQLAEVSRAVIVTYIRRLPKHQEKRSPSSNLDFQWSEWVTLESRKRLRWFVFMIDSHFPNLLNMPSMFSLSEAMRWECPCDDHFWTAQNARCWKDLLGTSPNPPAPSFAVAVAPFLGPALGHTTQRPQQALNLNPWSSFLVLTVIASKAFDYSQTFIIAEWVAPPESDVNGCVQMGFGNHRMANFGNLAYDRHNILDALHRWQIAYGVTGSSRTRTYQEENFLHLASLWLHRLSEMCMSISLTDLQDAIGNEGPESSPAGFKHLGQASVFESLPLRQTSNRHVGGVDTGDQRFGISAAYEALRIISMTRETSVVEIAAPYSTISIFLAHVTLWALARVSSADMKNQILQLTRDPVLASSLPDAFLNVLNSAFSTEPGSDGVKEASQIFKHGAISLAKFGRWGACLNVAVLLHWLAEH
ncbi:fungal-specific transcription factor domain-containing protein [Pseudomassariella vexata]|uniref:Fungal-specific transcription factor domain-domain-containing protein n=1 Tax=Pseudomassariella vexata TaxID=1141098 RepID=A0A1Y2DR13_9PEZI|nr:fungal-specific transcription factor domain-containing protein [Pseudomassariella vexata]ORY61629.1 fungal-specific transcription factor domain-domain-containing protein [Pseudomassariella vexata]